jgi:hypothetical protein
MNMVGRTPPKSGFTMCALPAQENAFTKRAAGTRFWSRSRSESFVPNEELQHAVHRQLVGIGFRVSITVLPANSHSREIGTDSRPCP